MNNTNLLLNGLGYGKYLSYEIRFWATEEDPNLHTPRIIRVATPLMFASEVLRLGEDPRVGKIKVRKL